MEIVYLGAGDLDLTLRERIQSGEVEPHCQTCRAKLEVRRFKGEPDGPITSVRCPTDQKHFMVTYRIADPEWNRILGRAPTESEE